MTEARAADARKADNATRQRKALGRMDISKRDTGLSLEEWDAWHADQRAQVLAKYGVAL